MVTLLPGVLKGCLYVFDQGYCKCQSRQVGAGKEACLKESSATLFQLLVAKEDVSLV